MRSATCWPLLSLLAFLSVVLGVLRAMPWSDADAAAASLRRYAVRAALDFQAMSTLMPEASAHPPPPLPLLPPLLPPPPPPPSVPSSSPPPSSSLSLSAPAVGPPRSTPDARGECCIEVDGDRACVRAGMRLAFRDNALCERGTTVAVRDYADAWERLLCGVAYISSQDSDTVCPANNMVSTAAAFRARFGEERVLVTDRFWSTVDADLERLGISTLYQLMAGDVASTGTLPRCARNVVHAVFDAKTPHGDAYASISPEVPAAPGVNVVLHITRPLPALPPGAAAAARRDRGIGEGDTVLCRHGGFTTFDIDWARDALCRLLAERAAAPDRPWLLLLNTAPLACAGAAEAYGRLVYLPAMSDDGAKARFLATCDACLHARSSGESFGLAVAECAMAGLPVITHGGRGQDGDYHLRVLGRHALVYFDAESLRARIDAFDPAEHRPRADVYRALYDASSERRVMLDFLRAFRPELPAKC